METVYKIFSEQDGNLCSAIVGGSYRFTYRKGEIYNGVFAFSTMDNALRFGLSFDEEAEKIKFWRCKAEKAIRPKLIINAGTLPYVSKAEHFKWLERLSKGEITVPNVRAGYLPPILESPPPGTVICWGLTLEREIE